MEEERCGDLVGKTVRVRHASEGDLGFIAEELRRNHIQAGDLDVGEFVVAVEDGKIIGFGRLRRVGTFYQIGCIVVIEERRRRGIGSFIVQHLLETTPVQLVYIVTDLVDYFRGLGFFEMREVSKELLDSLDEACRLEGRPDTVIMVYERPSASGA